MAIVLLAALSLYFTGNAGEASLITILFNASGAVAYYALERFWNSIEWGRAPAGATPHQAGLLRAMDPSLQPRSESPPKVDE